MSEIPNPYQSPESNQQTQPPIRWASAVIPLLTTIAIVFVVAALILPNVRFARESERILRCKNNLKNISLALINYASSNGGNFPPAYTVDDSGKRLHSWRTLILAYLDRRDLYDRVDFSKPWDDPSNAEILKSHVSTYTCPMDDGSDNMTTYQAIVAPGSFFPDARSRNISEFTDGMGQTLMVVEVCHKDAIPWMCPWDTDEQSFLIQASKELSPHDGGCNVSYADGSIGFLLDSIDSQVLRALISVAGNDVLTGNEF